MVEKIRWMANFLVEMCQSRIPLFSSFLSGRGWIEWRSSRFCASSVCYIDPLCSFSFSIFHVSFRCANTFQQDRFLRKKSHEFIAFALSALSCLHYWETKKVDHSPLSLGFISLALFLFVHFIFWDLISLLSLSSSIRIDFWNFPSEIFAFQWDAYTVSMCSSYTMIN